MSRIADRQLAILRLLESGQKVSIRTLMEETESSKSTVLRDISDLSVYPIETKTGRKGGIKLKPVAVVGRQYLTKDELKYIVDILNKYVEENNDLKNSILKKILKR